MVGQVKTVNGVKKIVPLTAEARAGNPVSTIIAIYSNLVPSGYLPCNGVQFDETQFPALYAILGDNHTPDLRECTLRGAGQNTTDSIATHDVYEVGEFKDDQLQTHKHSQQYIGAGNVVYSSGSPMWQNETGQTGNNTGRSGAVTRGKSKGVNYCIKATAGLDESDADYVLGVLAPVDEVALNNMHSVTSNAVAEKLANIFSANIDNSKFSMPAVNQEAVTADYTGFYYMTVQSSNTATVTIWEDDNRICNSDLYTSSGFVKQFVVLVRKGRKYKWSAGSGTHSIQFQYFVPFNI